jgi:hypothetical protein
MYRPLLLSQVESIKGQRLGSAPVLRLPVNKWWIVGIAGIGKSLAMGHCAGALCSRTHNRRKRIADLQHQVNLRLHFIP